MSQIIIDQLKEHAMVVANDLEAESGGDFSEELQAAFQRAMEFSEMICPSCWVKDNQSAMLTVSNQSVTTELHQCDKCGFNEELEKAD